MLFWSALPVSAQVSSPGQTGTGSPAASPSAVAPTVWFDYLSGPSRAEAEQLDRRLRSAEEALSSARTDLFAAIRSSKSALSERLLKEIRAAIAAPTAGATNPFGSSGPLFSGPALAARSALLDKIDAFEAGNEPLPSGFSERTLAALSKRVEQLKSDRIALIRRNLPDPGTRRYQSLVTALTDTLAAEGIDGSRLSRIGRQLQQLSSTITDTDKIRSYLKAAGGDLSRPPRQDDLAGWRFLMDQAVESSFLSTLLSPDLSKLAAALSEESSRIEPISPELAGAISRLAEDVRSGEDRVTALRRYAPELYADMNVAVAIASAGAEEDNGGARTASKGQEAARSLERSFSSLVADLRRLPSERLAVLIARDPLFDSLAGDTLRTLTVLDGIELYRFERAAGTDDTEVGVASALLERAYHDGHDRRLLEYARRLGDLSSAPAAEELAYSKRVEQQAAKTLKEASAALDESGDEQSRRWAFLSIMESRYSWRLLRSEASYARLRDAFDRYVSQVTERTDSLAASMLSRTGSEGPGGVALFPVVEYSPIFREVSAYREEISSDGVTVRTELPLAQVWEAYASAFYQVTQGRDSSVDPEAARTWALLHGQAAVNWEWAREPADAGPDVTMDSRLLDIFLHGVRSRDVRQLSTRTQFLRNVVAPWVSAARSAEELGSDAISGAPPDRSAADGMLPSDRGWERLAMGFLMLRREIVETLLSPLGRFGFVPRELLSDRERYTLEMMAGLDALTVSPPRFFSRLGAAWLGAPMTSPSPDAARRLADAIITGLSDTAERAMGYYSEAAGTVAAVALSRYLSVQAGESASAYAERAFRRINSEAARGRITVGQFRAQRARVLTRTADLAKADGVDPAAIGELLFERGLIRSEERATLGGRK